MNGGQTRPRKSSYSEGLNNDRIAEMQEYLRDIPVTDHYVSGFNRNYVNIEPTGVVGPAVREGERDQSTTGMNRDLSLAFKMFYEGPEGDKPGSSTDAQAHNSEQEQSMTDQAISRYHSQSQFYNKVVYNFTTFMHCFESVIEMLLLLVLGLFIACSLIAICYQTYVCFRDAPHFVLGASQYHEWLDGVFYVLIGVELGKSVLAQLGGDHSYVEVVGLVACTAIARSIVVQEYKARWDVILCMAVLIACMGAGVRLIRCSMP